MRKIREFYRRHKVAGTFTTILLLADPIARILNWIGYIDEFKSMMNPNYWVTRAILWPHSSLVISIAGLVLLIALIMTQKRSDQAGSLIPNVPMIQSGAEAFRPVPSAAPALTDDLPTPTTAASPVPDRIFVDVTPEFLSKLFNEHLNVQARKLIEVYIGKWIRVSGSLGDVYEAQVTFAYRTFETIVFMYPGKNKQFIDRCSVLSCGQHIDVIGKIKDVNAIEVHLEDCELIRP